MAEPRARFFDGMKFMWDGKDYESRDEAEKTKQEYEQKNFETRVVEVEGKFQVYTRRVVTEIEVEGTPP
jgi:hypothetical protein